MRVVTFNVRYDEPADGPLDWSHRRELALRTLQDHGADLIGLQEPTPAQWDDIAAALPDHTGFGIWRDEWNEVEARGGFFRTARFDALDEGLFWLSDTPTVAHSVTWPNDWEPRSCAWVRLRDRQTDRELVFATTHFDTNSESWRPSATVIHRELDAIAAARPIVLVGDFNCSAGSDAHRYLVEEAGFRDAWYDAGHADAGVVTFHDFTGATQLADVGNQRIDWILLRGLTCADIAIDTRRDGSLLPSDHYPVVANVAWNSRGPATGQL